MGSVRRKSTSAQGERTTQTRHYVTKHLGQVSASLVAVQWNGDQVVFFFHAAVPIFCLRRGFHHSKTLATLSFWAIT